VQLARRYQKDVDILGVAGRDDVAAMRDFVARHDLPFPNVADTGRRIWRAARARGQPVWVFVAPDGTAELFYRPSDEQVRTHLEALALAI
jgi:peroxiredoxin